MQVFLFFLKFIHLDGDVILYHSEHQICNIFLPADHCGPYLSVVPGKFTVCLGLVARPPDCISFNFFNACGLLFLLWLDLCRSGV